MRISFDALHSLAEQVDDLKNRVEQMMEHQQEAIEKEELKDNPKEERVQEMEQVNEILQEVLNNLESAHDTLTEAVAMDEDEE